MDQKCDRLNPSAPLENKNDDLDQRLENKVNYVPSFNNHVNNIKEINTYFKNKNHKTKKRSKNYKTLNTVSESVDSIIIIRATSTSITLSVTGVGLIILPIKTAIACTLSLSNKVLHKIIINKDNKYKKQYEKDQQTSKSFDKLYKKSLQDNVIDERRI